MTSKRNMGKEPRGPSSKSTAVDEADVIHFDGIGTGPPARYYPARDELYYVMQPCMALVVFGFLGLRREAANYLTCPTGEVLFEALTYARAVAVVSAEFAEQVEVRSDSMLKRGRAMNAQRASESGSDRRDGET